MTNLTKKATNKELAEAFGDAILDGQVRVVAVEDTANAEYQMLFIVQAVKRVAGEKLNLNEIFLGWSSHRLLRGMRNCKVSEMEAIKEFTQCADIKSGAILNNIGIRLEEKLYPQYEGQGCKMNPITTEAIQINGHDVFEHTFVVPAGEEGIITIPRDATVEQTASILLPNKSIVSSPVEVTEKANV